ncbi:MAG: 1-deoxy-D-xylulose-5-phosphate reductoisomerase, partial [Phycisphaerae bacterium]
MTSRQNVAILGATGSIGRATCEVLRHLGNPFRAWGLSAHRDWKTLLKLAQDLKPEEIILADSQVGIESPNHLPGGCRLKVGVEGLEALASSAEIDTVVAAIV